MTEEKNTVQVIIITGQSGAGKSNVANCLEDMGYYCVDNLPPALLYKFIELAMQSQGKIDRVALVIDVRGGDFFQDLFASLRELEQNGIAYEIIFLEASDEVLVQRFKESRRRHPLAPNSRLVEAIQKERSMLEELRGRANLIINTSDLTPRELKDKLTDLFSAGRTGDFTINVLSFGYKLGIPMDSDIIMDVRFLPNPFYDPQMRSMTGKDQMVIDYVLGAAVTRSFSRRFLNLLRFLIPYYIQEGKTNLAISIGCTGGQHRSVVLADYVGEHLKKAGYNTVILHRDLPRYKMEA